jgi:hypothetical protein
MNPVDEYEAPPRERQAADARPEVERCQGAAEVGEHGGILTSPFENAAATTRPARMASIKRFQFSDRFMLLIVTLAAVSSDWGGRHF